jgi:hypothetical protein
MKYLSWGLFLLMLFYTIPNVSADKLYTWTDENGNLHITETPPPKNAKTKDVMTYRPQTEAQIHKIKAADRREEMQYETARKKDVRQQTSNASATSEQPAVEEVYTGREGKLVRHAEEIKEFRDRHDQVPRVQPYHRK